MSAGFDRRGELEHCHDFQLPPIEGLFIARIIENETTPVAG
jgi:hypothetical protein